MSNKVYVDVLAEFSRDGLLIPKEITWENGRKYEITRVKDKRRAARSEEHTSELQSQFRISYAVFYLKKK